MINVIFYILFSLYLLNLVTLSLFLIISVIRKQVSIKHAAYSLFDNIFAPILLPYNMIKTGVKWQFQ